MRFTEAGLKGAWLVDLVSTFDDRGSFARTFCENEFHEHGLETRFVQHSISTSSRLHTLRGMHFQKVPHREVKLVSCLQGAVWDVMVDLRTDSPTYGNWAAYELSPQNGRQLYIPRGFAHGYLTLADDTVISYLISEFYCAPAASGVRYDDPRLGITWPAEPAVISERDKDWPLLGSA
ncbi:dTDP-4-dehydrorhamnose 3,5-epimerase [Rhizobiaceae bacterium n13]|uniref:dTDP-4-dehydrorhamnose 3,5-epimerase n=1 Tax=Ferirhizobium litorale TaxID=2927786 RepID=A0AAE3U211_9HYPH|nr:dTDP-4-dehydrorhamnose 3,5-epimerase [Fererhizobium litorale]MDI7860745.1 dTDP-4-dehydrorhamnose 3,5-epimerase [Fererhizobium litorale]MDI7920893.1 dTDP-4-dehydrorhamnose 3,5-epimerase [Fererhizobium litorale]